jgi:hypothetical protein
MTNDIIDFFDQEMLLYELVGSTNNTSTIIDYNPKKISFLIDGNRQDISRLSNQLAVINQVIEYDKPLGVDYSMISDRSLQINITTL